MGPLVVGDLLLDRAVVGLMKDYACSDKWRDRFWETILVLVLSMSIVTLGAPDHHRFDWFLGFAYVESWVLCWALVCGFIAWHRGP